MMYTLLDFLRAILKDDNVVLNLNGIDVESVEGKLEATAKSKDVSSNVVRVVVVRKKEGNPRKQHFYIPSPDCRL
jgi:hypothetical protein